MKKEIRSLTGLRGVAAVLVVLYHGFRRGLGEYGFLLHNGYLCVDIFFVLSGFVMALTYKDMFSNFEDVRRHYFKFMWLRVARIYPLYVVSILVCALLMYVGLLPYYSVSNIGESLAWSMFMMQAWSFGAGNINLAAWSISTEFSAYLMFPFIVSLIVSRSGSRMAAFLALAAVAAYVCFFLIYVLVHPAGWSGPLAIFRTDDPGPVLRCVVGFTLGVATYFLTQNSSIARYIGSPTLANIVFATLVVFFFVRGSDVLVVLLSAVLIVSVASTKSAIAGFLESMPVHYLGKISYSLYMVHIPCILVMRTLAEANGIDPLWANITGVVLAFLIAPFAFRFIEDEGRKFLRNVVSRSNMQSRLPVFRRRS